MSLISHFNPQIMKKKKRYRCSMFSKKTFFFCHQDINKFMNFLNYFFRFVIMDFIVVITFDEPSKAKVAFMYNRCKQKLKQKTLQTESNKFIILTPFSSEKNPNFLLFILQNHILKNLNEITQKET